MNADTNEINTTTIGADVIDAVIASGIDFDSSPIPTLKLEL
ncbi:hypothetical protein RintRC_6039 [Richelia intracellularis]|nr:hypothetical protein RintRC_6039 [Richelia intracellularis]